MTQRLQNAYPAISLEKAYGYMETVGKKVEDDVTITRKVLSKLMGFTSLSGTATNAAGSLVHFRLLRKVEGGYIITPLARRWIAAERDSSEWKDAARRTVTAPELYKYIYNAPSPVPIDLADRIIRKYSDKGVKAENLKHLIETYKESLRFANIMPQVGLDNLESKSGTDSHVPPNAERKIEVEVDGQRFGILDEYLIEAYEKTLQHDLGRMREKISVTSRC